MESPQEECLQKRTRNLYKVIDPTRLGYLYRNDYHTHVNFFCLDRMYSDRMLSDVVLVSDDMEIHAHKVILAACSAFFYFKFSNDRKLGMLNRIKVLNMSYETLSAVITFFYKSEIFISEENVKDLLAAAYNFAVPDLQEACWDFMQQQLSPRNCLGIRTIAERLRSEKLVPIVLKYIEDNFTEVIKNDEYLQLPFNNILDLVNRDELCATEDDVLESVIRWVRFDLQNRRAYFHSLMNNVKLSLISREVIRQWVEEEEWLKSEPQFLLQFIDSHIASKGPTSPINRRQSKLLMVVGIAEDDYLSMEIYDFNNMIWLKGPEIFRIKCTRAAIYNTKIYCIHKGRMKCIDFSSTQMAWVNCNHVILRECHYSVVVFNNAIYAAGGWYDGTDLETAERYDTSSEQWIDIADMSEAKVNVSLGALNEHLYAVGGWTSNSRISDSVEMYDPDSDSWQFLTQLSINRYDSGVGALDDTLFIVGGYSDEGCCKQVECYNPVDTYWSQIADINVARQAPGVIAIHDHLYVLGGYNNKHGYLNSVEIYDPKTDTWSMLPSKMNTGKYFVTAALINKSSIKF